MSFLFGKSKKQQTTALPATTREITSSNGEKGTMPPIANRMAGEKTFQMQTPTPGSSVNASLNSLQGGGANTDIAEPKSLRDRSESEVYNGRMIPPALSGRTPSDSPYPWAQRRLNFTTTNNPFPRYGAAVNATASKEGWIYLMGGLINGQTVKGDLWMVEAATGSMACYPIATTSEGPGPRVGHSSLLVGNAFIVFGGDTKMDDGDILDDTLYLLNTATKQWSRALPAGPRPPGRYGHTLNILGSKIYIFGGQVEGFFFNDLVAFDLNQLQAASNRWEVLIQTDEDGNSLQGPVPAPRTNHSVVTWNDKLYLFGGTDGVRWFNDVWTYDPKTNLWTELDCIGYIPTPREGHAAALVNDTMYIFGGRVQEGTDLGDLAAFRISSRRWYMFQNMGPSPSPRSGHSMTAYGRHIVVLAGEPSSAPRDPNELSLAYVLDTSKIRYPPNEQQQAQQNQSDERALGRKYSAGERNGVPQARGAAPVAREGGMTTAQYSLPPSTNGAPASRLPRPGTSQGQASPLPHQQAPHPRSNGVAQGSYSSRRDMSAKGERGYGPPVDTSGAVMYDQENILPSSREEHISAEQGLQHSSSLRQGNLNGQALAGYQPSRTSLSQKQSMDTVQSGSVTSRSGSRSTRGQASLDSIEQTPRPSTDGTRTMSRETDRVPVDSGVGSSPALTQLNDDLIKELEAAKSRNAWLASELALARKAGYQANASGSPILDERSADAFADDDKPLVEAMLRMRAELAKVQGSIEDQAITAASKIAEVEKQRDAAINEAVYAKAKLAAHGGSQAGTPQLDIGRGTGTPDIDRLNEVNRRLASSLAVQTELSSKVESLTSELEAEKRARQLAEDTAEAVQKRVDELDTYRQRNASEVESLKAELHEAQRIAREEAANFAEASASSKLLEVDKSELATKNAKALEDAKHNSAILHSLQDAVAASTDKANLLERKLEDQTRHREAIEQKLSQLKAEHENRTSELESTTRRLRDAEELAEKHAEEARTHREAVLLGLNRTPDRDEDEHEAADERVTILQQQVEAANAMVRKNQDAADSASEKLRRAEERIAGLEAYQEQASREGLTIRKQLQSTMRELQSLQAEKADIQQQLDRHHLESNASEVQLKTLKNLLEERGINAADVRRSRALDSPGLGSRFGTPEMNRVRELEQQLDASIKAHDEIRSTFEQREQEVSKEWEEKLVALDNDHQAAVKYVRGIEKMLAKMKQELQRTKAANSELEKELTHQKSVVASLNAPRDAPDDWEAERESLRAEISDMQENVKTSITQLESQINDLQTSLAESEKERQSLHQSALQVQQRHQRDLEATAAQARADLDHLRHENALLEERAKDAENKVQLFLDQFESSVDNYRRMSHQPSDRANGGYGHGRGHASHHSMSGDSIYSTTTDATDATETPSEYIHNNNYADYDDDDGQTTPSVAQTAFPVHAHGGGSGGGSSSLEVPPAMMGASHHAPRDRSSTALDSLANELDALRTHWETTNKNYRLSDRFDFEQRTPTSERGELSESLASWRRRLDLDEGEGGAGDEGVVGRRGERSPVRGRAGGNGMI